MLKTANLTSIGKLQMKRNDPSPKDKARFAVEAFREHYAGNHSYTVEENGNEIQVHFRKMEYGNAPKGLVGYLEHYHAITAERNGDTVIIRKTDL